MYDINIKGVSNGWTLKIGCETFVAIDLKFMLKELGRYIEDPSKVENEYRKKRVNEYPTDDCEEDYDDISE